MPSIQFSVSAEEAIENLLKKPYPQELQQIRHRVVRDFPDEETAKMSMADYCTEEMLDSQMVQYQDAAKTVREILLELQ